MPPDKRMCPDAKLKARIAYWGWRCWICKGPYDFMDHVIPRSRGGPDWPSNLRPVCNRCNAMKGNRFSGKLTNYAKNLIDTRVQRSQEKERRQTRTAAYLAALLEKYPKGRVRSRKCLRCGWSWVQRTPKPPSHCPRCGSTKYNQRQPPAGEAIR